MEKMVIRLLAKKPNKGSAEQLACSDRDATAYVGVCSEKPVFGSPAARQVSETVTTHSSSVGDACNTRPEKDRRRLRLSLRSGRAAAEEKPEVVVVRPKKSAYVPTHAGSDFSSLPMPTTFRQSQAYEWRHGYAGEGLSACAVSKQRPCSHSSHSSLSTRSSGSGWNSPAARSSGQESCGTTVSDRHSTYSAAQSSAAKGRHRLGRQVSEYIRPPLVRDPSYGTDYVSTPRPASCHMDD